MVQAECFRLFTEASHHGFLEDKERDSGSLDYRSLCLRYLTSDMWNH